MDSVTKPVHAKNSSMPSLLNAASLRSSTTPKQSSSWQQPKLSSAHIDLWEHAALLYHHFEWPSAIETFQHLALTIPTSAQKARTLCCLNAGIIQARLGDYVLAAQTFESAARTDGDFILTPFLLGIVEWELGNLIKAEACLEISLLALRRHGRDGEVEFSRYGLGFKLRDEVVEEVLRRLRGVNPLSSEEAAQSTMVGFVGFSADYIFEAAAREDEVGELVSRRGEEQVVPTGKPSISRQPDYLTESSPKPAVKNPRETLKELKSFLRGHKPLSSPHPTTTRALPPPDPPRPPQPPITAEATYHSTWRRRPPTPYVPRDARGEYHSVRELARFIRKYQNQTSPMSPRDPRGEAESTGELARFIRCAGRGGGSHAAGALRMPFLEGGWEIGGIGGGEVESLLDLYLLREDGWDGLGEGEGWGGEGDCGGGGGERNARRYSDPIPAHITTMTATGSTRIGISTDPNTPTSSHFPSSSEDEGDRTSDETITLLLPNVYKGTPPKPNNSRPSLQLLDRSSPHHGEEGDNPLANFHTAGSETSSLFRHSMLTIERAEVARGEALRRLEGRARAGGKSLRRGVGWGRRAGSGGRREREESEERMRREADKEIMGRSSGQTPTLATTADPTAAVGVVSPVPDLSNGRLDGNGIPGIKMITTTTVATTEKANLLLPSQLKPLPPGPPRRGAGRFEVFSGDEYQRGDLGNQYGGGGRRVVGEVGRREEEENREGGWDENAVRVPSSKIFEYMSRG
ncbi:hypothetical protein KC361_g5490 [Hortaea werneckii]|nr:hypothetical protein KC361_g5490 [Hortaea werneckii]